MSGMSAVRMISVLSNLFLQMCKCPACRNQTTLQLMSVFTLENICTNIPIVLMNNTHHTDMELHHN